MLEKIFHLKKRNTTIKTELIAGLTTFLAMAYVLAVIPGMLSVTGMSLSGAFVATAVSSAIASILMGIFANCPIALSAGMGVNAVFTYTIVEGMGLSWQGALACVFVSGILFVIISLTGLRSIIINAIPSQLKLAIGAGIGFFIAFIGLKNAGIVVADNSTFVKLGNLTAPVVLLGVLGVVITIFLLIKKVSAAVFYGMAITAIVGIVWGFLGAKGMPALPSSIVSVDLDFSLAGTVFTGFHEMISHPQCWLAIFSLLFVDFFDTAGMLVAVAANPGLSQKNGELENLNKALLSDAVGTVIGAMMGTSTVTSFVESTSGIKVGGRTGLTACVTGTLFLLALFFSPLLSCITEAVTAPALIAIGILMVQQLKDIRWDNLVYAASVFITIIVMVLGYSISNGIAMGFIVYVVGMVANNEAKKVNPIVWVLVVLFLIYFGFLL